VTHIELSFLSIDPEGHLKHQRYPKVLS